VEKMLTMMMNSTQSGLSVELVQRTGVEICKGRNLYDIPSCTAVFGKGRIDKNQRNTAHTHNVHSETFSQRVHFRAPSIVLSLKRHDADYHPLLQLVVVVLLALVPLPGPQVARPPCHRDRSSVVRNIVSKVVEIYFNLTSYWKICTIFTFQ